MPISVQVPTPVFDDPIVHVLYVCVRTCSLILPLWASKHHHLCPWNVLFWRYYKRKDCDVAAVQTQLLRRFSAGQWSLKLLSK